MKPGESFYLSDHKNSFDLATSFQDTKLFKNCTSQDADTGVVKQKRVALAPKDSPLVLELQAQFNKLPLISPVLLFDSIDDLQNTVSVLAYEENICFGVGIDEETRDLIRYSLMFNETNEEIVGTQDQFDPLVDEIYKERIADYYTLWITYGFMDAQNLVDNIILAKKTGASGMPKISHQIFPQRLESYIEDPLSDIILGRMSIFLIFPLILIFLHQTTQVFREKETKLRDSLQIIGMKMTAFNLSIILQYLLVYLILSLIISLVLSLVLFPNSQFLIIFLLHYLFCVTLIFQAQLMSSLVTRAKVGNLIAMIFFLGPFIFSLVQTQTESYLNKTLYSMISQLGFGYALDVLFVSEAQGVGIDFTNIWTEINNYKIGVALMMYFVNIAINLLLALYLDQVLPNEYGKRQHPFFCFCLNRCTNQKAALQNMNNGKTMALDSGNIEPVNAQLRNQETNKQVLKIENLQKKYSNGKIAVKGLSVTLYQSQIFVLLGHNGAGKTTTIQMLTGLLDTSGGNVNILGYDLKKDIEKIKEEMGICPQQNIIYDNLTPKEHLYLYAALKGKTQSEKVDAEVESLIQDVGLQEKANQLSKTLSGGQKRRLCVALSFIGGSKVIYLDEPTSGMDTSARRSIWEMLKKYKQNRIIILTTHHMDEADYLGDRIAIMGEGKLLCCGSSVFLKNKFGIGYNLIIVKSSQTSSSEEIKLVVQNHVPSMHMLSDVSAEIQFQLPISQVGQFEGLFKDLDNYKVSKKISSYGISITTMEEVFLKVGQLGSEASEEIFVENKEKLKKELSIKTKIIVQDDKDKDLESLRQTEGLFLLHLGFMMKKRLLYFSRDLKALGCEIFIPIILMVLGLVLVTTLPPAQIKPPNIFSPANFNTKQDVIYAGLVDNTKITGLLDFFPKDYFEFQYVNTDSIAKWDEEFYNQRESLSHKGAYWIEGINENTNTYDFKTAISTINRDALPIFVNSINQAVIRQATANPNFKLEATNRPFYPPYVEAQADVGIEALFLAVLFSAALTLIVTSIITFLVKEKEDQIKHQQFISGITIIPYWLANLLIDYAKGFITACIGILLVFLFGVKSIIDSSEIYASFCILFFVFMYAMIPFTYLTSFIFSTHGGAQTTTFFFHFVFGIILPVTCYIFRITVSLVDVGLGLAYVFRLIPSFCFPFGFLSLMTIENLSIIAQQKLTVWDFQVMGGDVYYLVTVGTICIVLVYVVEHLRFKGIFAKKFQNQALLPYTPKLYDVDVANEAELIAETNPATYSVHLNKLRKVYKQLSGVPPKAAVDQVSFGIKKGEVYTLLGVNGAGKTTTFKMLTGDVKPTSGTAHVYGYDVVNNMENARKHLGYCPQFDALFENLTVREHLDLYAAIKGIADKQKRLQVVRTTLQELDLKKFEFIRAGTLSGGNKRKLSVGIAMIGNPPVIFLDEPSTGMDPATRRFMWDIISRIATQRKQTSIILTTHSMEEAEALSNRIGIQVDGQLQCLGSIQHIKNKFGTGYEVEVKLNLPTSEELSKHIQQMNLPLDFKLQSMQQVETYLKKLNAEQLLDEFSDKGCAQNLKFQLEHQGSISIEQLIEFVTLETQGVKVKEFITEKISNFTILEHFQAFYRFQIEGGVNIGYVFSSFEKMKDKLNIAQYSVKQATIEQIFNAFAEGKNFNNEKRYLKWEKPEFEPKRSQVNGMVQSKLASVYKNEVNSNNHIPIQIELKQEKISIKS